MGKMREDRKELRLAGFWTGGWGGVDIESSVWARPIQILVKTSKWCLKKAAGHTDLGLDGRFNLEHAFGSC